MKPKRNHKREQNKNLRDNTRDGNPHRKKNSSKFKYRHKSHWLEEDDAYDFSRHKNEEE